MSGHCALPSENTHLENMLLLPTNPRRFYLYYWIKCCKQIRPMNFQMPFCYQSSFVQVNRTYLVVFDLQDPLSAFNALFLRPFFPREHNSYLMAFCLLGGSTVCIATGSLFENSSYASKVCFLFQQQVRYFKISVFTLSYLSFNWIWEFNRVADWRVPPFGMI